jgi:hypothetical protein
LNWQPCRNPTFPVDFGNAIVQMPAAAMTDTEQAQEMVREAVLKLGEHFESVRIFVTRANPESPSETQAIDEGTGNFYAQLGQITEWLSIQDQYQRNWAKRNDQKINPPDTD